MKVSRLWRNWINAENWMRNGLNVELLTGFYRMHAERQCFSLTWLKLCCMNRKTTFNIKISCSNIECCCWFYCLCRCFHGNNHFPVEGKSREHILADELSIILCKLCSNRWSFRLNAFSVYAVHHSTLFFSRSMMWPNVKWFSKYSNLKQQQSSFNGCTANWLKAFFQIEFINMQTQTETSPNVTWTNWIRNEVECLLVSFHETFRTKCELVIRLERSDVPPTLSF